MRGINDVVDLICDPFVPLGDIMSVFNEARINHAVFGSLVEWDETIERIISDHMYLVLNGRTSPINARNDLSRLFK